MFLNRFPKLATTMVAIIACMTITIGCQKKDSKKPKIAFVTNCVASFWVIAEAGCQKGAEEAGVEVEVLMPSDGSITSQKQMIEDALTRGLEGIAISPIDPKSQGSLLKMAAERTNMITHDSDAPDSPRLCYIGMDNYLAGLMVGELTRDAIPDGGKVAIFIGRMEQYNSRRRRQGMIDGLLGREPDPSRNDPPAVVIKEAGYEIVGTYTDQADQGAAKTNAENVLSRHADIKAMVGLFAYNPPAILEALKQAGKIGEVKVIGFDEADETLRGIEDGAVAGTVVQNPFEYGRQSVRILAGLNAGKTLAELDVPESKFLNIPARKITKENVTAFTAELNKNLGK